LLREKANDRRRDDDDGEVCGEGDLGNHPVSVRVSDRRYRTKLFCTPVRTSCTIN
jgi:hypothetical protein